MRRKRVLESQVLRGDSCRLLLAPVSQGSPSQEQRGRSDSHTHRQMPAGSKAAQGTHTGCRRFRLGSW